MTKTRLGAQLFLLGLLSLSLHTNLNSQSLKSLASDLPPNIFTSETNRLLSSTSARAPRLAFSNPTVRRFEDGCVAGNIRSKRFASEIPASQRMLFCRAFQSVSNKLNQTDWSPALREELEAIWQVFLTQDVKIRPMRKKFSKRILLAAEPFTRGQGNYDFTASIYIRPKYVNKKLFFVLAMHELRHIYDFYRLYESETSLSEGEMEKRGFRIMGRIARETKVKEKFKALPKVWKSSWKMYSSDKFHAKMEKNIVKFMRRSPFYRDRLRNPSRYLVNFVAQKRTNERRYAAYAKYQEYKASRNSGSGLGSSLNKRSKVASPKAVDKRGKALAKEPPANVTAAKTNPARNLTAVNAKGRLPAPEIPKLSKSEVEPVVLTEPFGIAKARDNKNPDDLLSAALKNEELLYKKMNRFSYEENFRLQCWKKQRVTEWISRSREVSRDTEGKPSFENEKVLSVLRKKKLGFPSCVIDPAAIKTDASETFWAGAYLNEMPIKFDYFTKHNGTNVARYTVYKPAKAKFEAIAGKFPNIKPFRVFVGTIFVSVEDSQIVKFWGTSFPERATTGNRSGKALANYNATALRKRLGNGLWVTSSVSTVAVANKKGKAKPFRYVVNYKNYRKKN